MHLFNKYKKVIFEYLIFISIFSLYLNWGKVNSISIILLFIFSLTHIRKGTFLNIFKSIRIYFFPLIVYFIIHFLFIHYSKGNEWIHTVEVKMCFIALPIICIINRHYINEPFIHRVFVYSFWLLLGLFLILEIKALYKFQATNDYSEFFYSYLTRPYIHPGYFSNFYLVTATYFLIDYFKTKYIATLIKCLILAGIIILLNSKTIFLCLIILLLYYYPKIIIGNKSLLHRLCIILLPIIGFIGLYNTSFFHTRFNEFIHYKRVNNNEINTYSSTAIRSLIWKCQWEIIKESPLIGHGTGSTNRLLLEKYKQHNYAYLVKSIEGVQIPSHNQFLRTWIDLGVLGICSLVCLLLFYFILFYRIKNTLGQWGVIYLFPILFTDDMFEIQISVVFFITIICILVANILRSRD